LRLAGRAREDAGDVQVADVLLRSVEQVLENVSWSPFETFSGPSAVSLVFGALSR